MPFTVQLRSESGEILDPGGIVEFADLPAFDDGRFPFLRLIDPYGNTVFNEHQVKHQVLDEIERYALERPSPGIDLLLALARKCAKRRVALWFFGD